MISVARRIKSQRKTTRLGEACVNNSFCICVVQNLRMLFDQLFRAEEGKENIKCHRISDLTLWRRTTSWVQHSATKLVHQGSLNMFREHPSWTSWNILEDKGRTPSRDDYASKYLFLEVRWWPLSEGVTRWIWNTEFLQITKARHCAFQRERDSNENRIGNCYWCATFVSPVGAHRKAWWTTGKWMRDFMKES